MAERSVAAADALFDVPDGLDDASAAALGNSGLAGWLALAWRADLQPGETVLVLGATGQVGSVAVQAAKLPRRRPRRRRRARRRAPGAPARAAAPTPSSSSTATAT